MAIPREPDVIFPNKITDGLRRDYTPAPQITLAYLLGILHDSTERKTTYRIASKSRKYCFLLRDGIKSMGFGAWVYKEGKDRNLWITEFSKNVLKDVFVNTKQDKIDYSRGYFDADGGIAKSPSVRYYIYFAQKDKRDLLKVKGYLKELEINCGKIHNPSMEVDPNYWRFFVRARSYNDFAKLINSSHPDKRRYLRMKI
jgi:hypothetical protein